MMRPSFVGGLLLCTLAALRLPAQQTPAGVWTGHWVRDGSALTVEMTFVRTPTGFEGSFSSPQLRVVGIPLTKIRHEPPVLRWEIVGDATTMVFEGTVRGDTIAGRFQDGTASGTFALTRARSQPPAVREEEITFANGAVTLSGTIVAPVGNGPFPGIVFLHGSGAEGRWASRFLAQQFARRGVAALIYDKRGAGRSTGDWRAVGFAELAGDAAAAVETLRSRSYVAPGRVGIHGHSQGGTIAPWVATLNRNVAFVVGSAASGVSMAEAEIFSLENSVGMRSLSGAEKALAQRYVRAVVATAYDGAPRAELDSVWKEARTRSWVFELPPANHFYWAFSRRIASYDPLEFWRQVSVPALLLYGEADERVPVRRGAARIAEAYLGATGRQLEILIFPLADHTFRLRQGGPGAFAWPTTVGGYPERLIEWVLRVSRP